MIHIIANKLVDDHLDNITFKDKITGIVKPARIQVGQEGTVKIFPIAYNTDPDTCDDSELIDFCPDTSKRSIIYLEDLGAEVTGFENDQINFSGNMRLVVWFNYKKVSPLMTNPSLVALNVLANIPQNLGNFENLIDVWIQVIRQEPNDASPFSRYTYIEEASQFVTYPYDYVSFILNATWKVRLDCIPEIIVEEEEC